MAWAATLVRAFATPNLGPVRPWTWSTDDATVAVALTQNFHQLGIDQGLEVLGVATAQEWQLADEEWLGFWDEFRSHYDGEMARWIQTQGLGSRVNRSC